MAWAIGTKAFIVWRGNYGGKKKLKSGTAYADSMTIVRGPANSTLATAFWNALQTYTDCTKNIRSWQQVSAGGTAPPVSGTVSVLKKAIVYARRPGGKRLELRIPGIKDAYIETQSEGKRLTIAALNDIVALWSTCCGETLTPLWSKIVDEG